MRDSVVILAVGVNRWVNRCLTRRQRVSRLPSQQKRRLLLRIEQFNCLCTREVINMIT